MLKYPEFGGYFHGELEVNVNEKRKHLNGTHILNIKFSAFLQVFFLYRRKY